MQGLKVTLEPSDANILLARLEGAFDGSIKEPLAELEAAVSGAGPQTRLVLDLKGLIYLNSYAIGQLVAWHNHLMKTEGEVLLAGAGKNVEDIFTVLGLSALFKIFPTLEEAIQSLKS